MKKFRREDETTDLNHPIMSEQMSFDDFLSSTVQETKPPSALGPALAALWQDRRGNWEAAHTLAQEDAGKDGAWVHAYLHRKEGDKSNAAYWYRLSGRPVCRVDLDEEWRQIARSLLVDKH